MLRAEKKVYSWFPDFLHHVICDVRRVCFGVSHNEELSRWFESQWPPDLQCRHTNTPDPAHCTAQVYTYTYTHTRTQKLLIWLVKIKRLRLFVLHKYYERSYCGSEVLLIFLHHDYKKTKSAPEAAVLSAVRDLISLFGNSDASQQLTSAQCLWLQLVLWTTTGNIVINKQPQQGQRSAFSSAVCPTVTGTTCKTGKMLKTQKKALSGFAWTLITVHLKNNLRWKSATAWFW